MRTARQQSAKTLREANRTHDRRIAERNARQQQRYQELAAEDELRGGPVVARSREEW